VTAKEAAMIYRQEREASESRNPDLPPVWTCQSAGRGRKLSLGDGSYLTKIEPAE